jgi:hypothetical protein
LEKNVAALFSPGNMFALRPEQHARSGAIVLSMKMRNTLCWLLQTCELYGERSPEDGRIHVLMFLNPTWLHGQLSEWSKSTNEPILKLRRFLDLFNGASSCSHVLDQIVWKRDVKAKRCGICVEAVVRRSELVRAGHGRNSNQWQECHEQHCRHLSLVGNERKHWMLECRLAGGSEKHVIIMDAGHPLRHARKTIDTDAGRSLGQFVSPLLGLTDHSLGVSVLFSSPASGIPRYNAKGELTGSSWDAADVEVTILLAYLVDLHEKRGLRPHLHVQVDGGSTARSFALFCTLGLVLGLGWVKRITVASLIPGKNVVFAIFFGFLNVSQRAHTLRH